MIYNYNNKLVYDTQIILFRWGSKPIYRGTVLYELGSQLQLELEFSKHMKVERYSLFFFRDTRESGFHVKAFFFPLKQAHLGTSHFWQWPHYLPISCMRSPRCIPNIKLVTHEYSISIPIASHSYSMHLPLEVLFHVISYYFLLPLFVVSPAAHPW